ncbi:ABC transporter permease [Embleya sp. NPDC056575]|uniref:ABC transporter permease n=1 Tax=unclassified Embleya TaxID=2699296 RepID=UPI0036B14BDD
MAPSDSGGARMTSQSISTTTHVDGLVGPGFRHRRSRLAGRFSRRFVLTQFAGSACALMFVIVVNFFLFRVINPHPERTLGRGKARTAEDLEEIRHRLGLDESMWMQFGKYLKQVFTGDFGVSFQYSKPVPELIGERIWPTLLLVLPATVLSIRLGSRLGSRQAWRHGGRFDRSTSAFATVMYSMPEWWLGLLLFMVFAANPVFGVFPIGGLHSPGVAPMSVEGVADTIWHLVLPTTTLTVTYLAEYSMIMRSSMLDVMGEDYLLTGRAKGLSDRQVLHRHALPNARLPLTTLVALNLAFTVGGAITIETVFSIPGLGLLTSEAMRIPDLPLLQALFLVFSAAVVVANLVANFIYALQDPRVKA